MTDYNMDDSNDNVQMFRAQIQGKIQKLLDEFASGKISREQFHILYERYTSRLAIAENAMFSGSQAIPEEAQSGPSTLDIRASTEGKARGMMVFHHHSGRMLETLGLITITPRDVSATLGKITHQVQQGRNVEPHLDRIGDQDWLLFVTKHHTTVITEFQNEPSRVQIRSIERLHNDFEEANRRLLINDDVEGDSLAYPFLVFVQNKLKP